MIIALYEEKRSIPGSLDTLEYEYILGTRHTHASTLVLPLAKDLAKTGLVEFDKSTGDAHLSDAGRKFAQWLIETCQKAEYFSCPELDFGWGEESAGLKIFKERRAKEDPTQG